MSSAIPQHPTASNVAALLPKLNDPDSDLRYMSLSDLYNILNAGAPNFLLSDYNTCARTIDGLLKTLDDQNGEVQNQAIKCLGPLAQKVPPEILAPLIEKLSNLKTTNSVDNSIPATALRTLIISFPRPVPAIPPSKPTQDAYSAISKVLIPRLVGYVVISHGIRNAPNPPPGLLEVDPERGVDSDAIDVLTEVVRCFGPMLQDAEKKALQKAIVKILNNERTGTIIKKKAVIALSILAVYLSDALLSAFVSDTIESFQNSHLTLSKRRLLMSMVGSLARSVPQRLGPYLKTLAPFVLSALSQHEYENSLDEIAEDGSQNPEIEDVREAALVTLDSFLSSCSTEMRLYTEEAIEAALRYVNYDPSLAMVEDDEEMGGLQDLDDEEDENASDELNGAEDDFEEEEGMSDDDNVSWKVRRCAAKVLYTIISTRGSADLLENGTLYEKVAPALISCFKEREENVRLEILTTLASLVRKTGEGVTLPMSNGTDGGYVSALQTSYSRKRRRGGSDANLFDAHGNYSSSIGASSPAVSPPPVSGPRADLARLGPSIIRGVAKLLKHSSLPTKQAGITLLRDMLTVQHGGLSDHLSQLSEPIIDAIKTSSALAGGSTTTSTGGAASATGSSLRIEALQLVSVICDTHSSRLIVPYVGGITTAVIAAVKDKYYKVASEAIYTAESLVKVITPPRSAGTEQQHQAYLENLFDVILNRVTAHDADLEVRQRALRALGVLLARTSAATGARLLSATKRLSALDVLYDRLKNETTRIAAVGAIDSVAASAADKDGLKTDWVRNVSLELGAQLRKSDRILRGASLAALKNIVTNRVALANLDDRTVRGLVELLLPLLNANDLSLLGLALVVLANLVKRNPKRVVDSKLDSALCTVVLAPLGGAVLDAFLVLVSVIGEQGVGGALMQGFLKNVGVTGEPAIVGKAIGTLLVSGCSTVGVKLEDFATELQSAQDDQRKCLALSILGEAAFRLGTGSSLRPSLFISHFKSRSEQVPRAAAVALGRAGAGSVPVYLPVILKDMDKSGETQYLLLHSIKEILQNASRTRTDLSPHTKEIWKKLLATSQAEDNKAVGAECIGRLAIIEPGTFLPLLQGYLQDPVPTVRGMVIQAVRFTLADSDENFDEVLRPNLIGMLKTMLNDTNLENRRLALTTLNSATHNRPHIILPHLAQLLPLVIKESKIKPELVREVQMGPFKHKVDDGLEIRKSAYETLYALMQSAFSRINPIDLYDRIIAGLEDEHDIKVLCNLMLTKLISLDPDETVRRLDSIAERFRTVLAFKPKENAVKQDVEKAQEASKSVLRVTVMLHNAFPASVGPAATTAHGQAWKGYWEWVAKDYKAALLAMEQEVKNQSG